MSTLGGASLSAPEGASRLEVVHAFVFVSAVVLSSAGYFTRAPLLLLTGGPCFVASAAMRWYGIQLGFTGAFGRVLRTALGPTRLIAMRLHIVTWLIVGVGLTLWGVVLLLHPIVDEPFAPPAQLSTTAVGSHHAM